MNTLKIMLLSKKQWVEHRKLYGFSMMAMAGILMFLFLLTWHFQNSFSGGTNQGIFLAGLFVGGSLFISTHFKDLMQTTKGAWLVGLPASANEKLLVSVIYGIVFYLAIFLAIFFTTQKIFQYLVVRNVMHMQTTNLLKNDFYNFIFSFINLQLIVLLGSISFRRVAFLKTIILILIFFFLTNTVNNQLLSFMTGEANINGGGLYDYFQFVHAGENVYVYLPQKLQDALALVFHYLLPVSLYYITYLKFRETEI